MNLKFIQLLFVHIIVEKPIKKMSWLCQPFNNVTIASFNEIYDLYLFWNYNLISLMDWTKGLQLSGIEARMLKQCFCIKIGLVGDHCMVINEKTGLWG